MLRGTTSNFGTSLVAHMMTPGVVQIPGDVSVSEAAILMDRERIPCLLVKDNDARYGIMTSADIVKKVIAQGLEPQDVEVRSIMSQPVHSIEYDQATDEATSLMASSGTSLLIVTKQSQPVGILTARDLVLAPKRCETSIDATLRVTDGDGEGARHSAIIRQLSLSEHWWKRPHCCFPAPEWSLPFSPGIGTTFLVRGHSQQRVRTPPIDRRGRLIRRIGRRYSVCPSGLLRRIQNQSMGTPEFVQIHRLSLSAVLVLPFDRFTLDWYNLPTLMHTCRGHSR